MKCKFCNKEIDNDSIFCKHCGKRNLNACTACRNMIEIDSSFCKYCGIIVPAPRTIPAEFVDLGLPSGTLWKTTNENGFYNYDEAKSEFGNNLPIIEQLQELKDFCTWTFFPIKKGYEVRGVNGNSIFLPAEGGRFILDFLLGGAHGYYWSSTPNGRSDAWSLNFDSGAVLMVDNHPRHYRQSVRLVQSPITNY